MVGKYAFRFEPTAWLSFLRVLVYSIGLFWDPGLDPAQKAGLVALFEALVATLNRSLVSPTSTATSSVTVTTTETVPRNPEDVPR
jgi:hypothetical protein